MIVLFCCKYFLNKFKASCGRVVKKKKKPLGHDCQVKCVGIVGSVVECSPATRAARVRFPDDATQFLMSDQNYYGDPPVSIR